MDNMNTLNFLEKVLDKSIEYSHELIYDKNNQQHLCLIFLYYRLLELTRSCNLLMKENIISTVQILLRTVLETFADLKNLSDDANYFNFMKASYLYQWYLILKEAVSGDNPYLESISQMKDLKQDCAEHETELKKLKENNFIPLSNQKRLEKARMVNEHRSLYNSLCCDSHSNIRSLLGSYTNISGNDFTVICFKDPEPNDISRNSTILCDILVRASSIIHEFFNSGLNLKVKSIKDEWEELR